ncbi:MAG: transglutaminase domain-containing protein [Comamonadaceae bacterium]|nr:MAG: transglutaminase domain-containing protein [Comamonadaceae bacterium]
MVRHPEMLAAHTEDTLRWLVATPLIDLEDPKLRLRVRSLTQLCHSEREKALAVYGFVKRLRLCTRFSLRARTAREVHDAGCGGAGDKATLLVAMLRIAGIPARIRYFTVSGEILRGIAGHLREAGRPLVEIRLQGQWLRTDTYIYDAQCMAAARHRLRERGWEWGYGIHVGGAMAWNGCESAYLGGVPIECDLMVLREIGLVRDELEYRERTRPGLPVRLVRLLHWGLLAPMANRAWRSLRVQGAPASVQFHETY